MIEGKMANQAPSVKFNSGDPKPTCENCGTLVDRPKTVLITKRDQFDGKGEQKFIINHYVGLDEFIFETKSGRAIVYCGKWCAHKHNHRFLKAKVVKKPLDPLIVDLYKLGVKHD